MSACLAQYCDLDDGHDGPHVCFGLAKIWGSTESPLRLLVDSPTAWRILASLRERKWTEGELGYLLNIVVEQPDSEQPGRPRWHGERRGR